MGLQRQKTIAVQVPLKYFPAIDGIINRWQCRMSRLTAYGPSGERLDTFKHLCDTHSFVHHTLDTILAG
jgi:hypothetical protein